MDVSGPGGDRATQLMFQGPSDEEAPTMKRKSELSFQSVSTTEGVGRG
jgi:hypothetical protein